MEKSENGDREREKEMMKKTERPIYGDNEGWRERERERERQIYRDKKRLGEMEREFMKCIIFIPFETEYKIEK